MINKNCYIFFYDGYISTAPTIISLSKTFDKQDFCVTIFATQSNVPPSKELGNKVKIKYFNKFKLLEFLNSSLGSTIFNQFLEGLVFACQCLTEIFQIQFKTKALKNHINIAVDSRGSLAALLCYLLLKEKYLFLSLELEEPRKRSISRLIAKMTSLAYRKAEGVIIQDEDRFKTLCEYNQYQHPKVLYLPNSILNDLSTVANTGNFFREKFNLSQEEFPHIILSAGMIGDVVCSRALACAFASIDIGCALIFHGAYSQGITEEDPYMKSLRQVNNKNLFLSLHPLPYEQLDKMYTSSTIGLAFYENLNDNFAKIAKASGKLAYYLKHGKPVLASNFPSLSQLFNKYQIGILINNPSDPQEIKQALEQILGSYSKFSKNARACFEAEFSFEKNVEPVLSFINSLSQDSR